MTAKFLKKTFICGLTLVMRALTILFFGMLMIVATIYLLQDIMVYHPRPYGPDATAVSTRRLVKIDYQTTAGHQTAFYAAPRDGGTPTRLWLMFGGNGGLILEYHALIEQPALADTGMLLIDYPGYGYNEGHPSGRAIQDGIEAALAALATQQHTTPAELLPRIGLFGHSLGTGPALEFAAAHPEVRRLLLVAPYTSLYEMCVRVVGPIARLLKHNFDNEARLRELAARQPPPAVDIFTGAQDQVIPVAMSRRMAAEFPWVTYVEKPDLEHNHIVTDAALEISRLMQQMP